MAEFLSGLDLRFSSLKPFLTKSRNPAWCCACLSRRMKHRDFLAETIDSAFEAILDATERILDATERILSERPQGSINQCLGAGSFREHPVRDGKDAFHDVEHAFDHGNDPLANSKHRFQKRRDSVWPAEPSFDSGHRSRIVPEMPFRHREDALCFAHEFLCDGNHAFRCGKNRRRGSDGRKEQQTPHAHRARTAALSAAAAPNAAPPVYRDRFLRRFKRGRD